VAKASKELTISTLALATSVAAIVLSQFHPLYNYLDKPRFVASISTAQLLHNFGTPFVNVFTDLRNEGRAAGTITRLEIFIESATDHHFQARMPSQAYWPIPTGSITGMGPPPVPWAGVTLGPDVSWSSYVSMMATPSNDDQMKVNGFIQQAQAELATASPRRISDALFNQITDFTNQSLRELTAGNYFMLFLAFEEKGKTPIVAKCFSFALSPQDISQLSSITQQIRTLSPPGPPIILHLQEVTDPATVRRVQTDSVQGQ
jgi:hypothetical protein